MIISKKKKKINYTTFLQWNQLNWGNPTFFNQTQNKFRMKEWGFFNHCPLIKKCWFFCPDLVFWFTRKTLGAWPGLSLFHCKLSFLYKSLLLCIWFKNQQTVFTQQNNDCMSAWISRTLYLSTTLLSNLSNWKKCFSVTWLTVSPLIWEHWIYKKKQTLASVELPCK